MSALVASALVARDLSAQRRPSVRPPHLANDSTIVLSNGKLYVPGLHHINIFDSLKAPRGPVYLVLGGVPCTDCDVDGAIYLLAIGQLVGPTTPNLPYPGPQLVMGDEHPNAEVQSFIGSCLPDEPLGLISFWRWKNPVPDGVDSLYGVFLGADSLSARAEPWSIQIENEVRSQVQHKLCRPFDAVVQ